MANEYTFTVSQEEFVLLFNTLGELPAKASRMVMNKLQEQMQQQEMNIQMAQKEQMIEEAKKLAQMETEAKRRADIPEIVVDTKTHPEDARYADATQK